MIEKSSIHWSLLIFPLAGLVSALVTVWLESSIFGTLNILGSLAFGVFLSACFWLFLGVRSVWKTIAFVCLSPGAAVVSIWAGAAVPLPIDDARVWFVAGWVGAFLLFTSAAVLVGRDSAFAPKVFKSLLWAVCGGVLAIAGRSDAPTFHSLRIRLHSVGQDSDISLLFTWQIGMAFFLGLALWAEKEGSLWAKFVLRLRVKRIRNPRDRRDVC